MDYIALIFFTISTSITPGPNNTLILASGINYGVRKSLPHLLGIATGFPLMVIAIGLGLGSLFVLFPSLHIALKLVGAAYLIYLAYKLTNTHPRDVAIKNHRPFTFLQAALFQWVNPKAWMMAISACATFSSNKNALPSILIIAMTFILFGAPCTTAWLLFGSAMKKVLSNQEYQRIFNRLMALLLVSSLIPTFQELYVFFLQKLF